MASKFDFRGDVDKVRDKLKDDSVSVGTGADIGEISSNPEDYVVMPDWWENQYGVMGLQFGRIVEIAGTSDSGKTTLAMQAIKNAQEQGYGVLYVETEGKTPKQYFENWGIDPVGVMLAQSKFTENSFDAAFANIETFFENYPNDKLLFVFDSFGNTVSKSEEDNSMIKESRVGGTAKVNRKALNILISKMAKNPIATLIVNYTYDNIGSHGKTNAGGQALGFFSTLIIQAQRMGWLEGQVKGVRVRKGAKVKWTSYKNHYAQSLVDPEGRPIHLPKALELSITGEGFKPL